MSAPRDEPDLRALARRRLPIVAVLVLVGAAAASLVGRATGHEYTATAWVIYHPIELAEAPPPIDPSIPAAERFQGRSLGVIAERTAERLPEAATGAELLKRIATDYEVEASLLAVAATESDAEDAARLANAFSREYVSFWDASDRRRLRRARTIVRGRLQGMTARERRGRAGQRARRRLAEIERLFVRSPTGALFAKRARTPESPSTPSRGSRGVAGAALGLLLSLALVALLERRRPTPPAQDV